MNMAQRDTLQKLCAAYKVPFRETDYQPQPELPEGYVAGWIGGGNMWDNTTKGTIYVGVDPAGQASS